MPLKNSHFFLGLCLIFLLSACGGRSASTSFYVLDSGESTPAVTIDNLENEDDMPKIQLRKVDIPKYLDRNSIITRESNGVRLQLANFDSWAESLDSGAKRVIATTLSPLLKEEDIILQPLDDDSLGPWQIFIQIQRFDGMLGQNVVLDASWTVRNNHDTTLISGTFVDQASAGLDYVSLVQAQSNLLKKLAQSMAAPISAALHED